MSNIIVVDDDTANVQLLQMLLELDGFVVTPCTTVEQALDAIDEQTDAFVVDFHLERNRSGLDLLQAVRQGQTKAATDTVVVISSGDHRRQKEALDKGADQFLLKPYPPDDLTTLLVSLLQRGES